MRASNEYVLRQVAGTNMLLPIGQAVVDFNGMIVLNDSGAFLWNKLEQETTREKLAAALTEEYDVSMETALADVDEFLTILQNANCLTE